MKNYIGSPEVKGSQESEPIVSLEQNLKALLRSRGLSISQLAHRAGVNQSTLHNYVNGVVPRNLNSVLKLAAVLEISPSELLFGKFSKGEPRSRKYEITVREII